MYREESTHYKKRGQANQPVVRRAIVLTGRASQPVSISVRVVPLFEVPSALPITGQNSGFERSLQRRLGPKPALFSFLSRSPIKSGVTWLKKSFRSTRAPSYTTGLLAVAFLCLFGVYHHATNYTYTLSPAATKLVGTSSANPLKSLKYDPKAKVHATTGNAPEANSLHSGTNSYSASLHDDPSRGISLTDPSSQVSLGLAPSFRVGTGKLINGRKIYPLPNYQHGQLVYTLKQNGVEENLVLNQRGTKDTEDFSYKLNLSQGTEAKLLPDGSIGIYGADPTLLGTISTSSDKDKALLDKARTNAKKTTLLYGIPAPVIKQITANGQQTTTTSKATASFKLVGTTLTIQVKHLKQATYPLSIDPSLVLLTGTDWTAGNSENIDFTSTNQISRAGLTGGTIGAWSSNASLPASHQMAAGGTVIANGNIYILGGTDIAIGLSNAVYYAPIDATTGAVGTFTATQSFTTARNYMGAVTLDGYIYIMGGVGSGSTVYNDVQHAHIRTDGSLDPWVIDTGHFLPSARGLFVANAANGYIYALGGCQQIVSATGQCLTVLNTVVYTQVMPDGTLGAWSSASSFTTARFTFGSISSNGYMYISSGCNSGTVLLGGCNTYATDVQYAHINSTGNLDAWQSLGNAPSSEWVLSLVAYDGYIYWMPGAQANNVYYAPVYANGVIGAINSTTGISSQRYGVQGVVANGYLYMVGGYNSGANNAASDIISAKVDLAGTIRHQVAGASLPTPVWGASTFIHQGFIYVVGGCTAAPTYLVGALQPCAAANIIGHGADSGHLQGTSGDRLTIQFAHLSSTGGIDTSYTISGYTATNGWFTDKATCSEALATAADACPGSRYAYGGIYHGGVFWVLSGRGGDNDGTSNGNSLTFDTNGLQLYPDGTPGYWQTGSSGGAGCITGKGLNAAREFPTVSVYANFYNAIWVMGGRDGSGSVLNTVESGGRGYNGGGGNNCGWANSSNNLPSGVWQAASFGYNGSLYLVGGRGSGSTYYGSILKEAPSGAWSTACSPCTGLPASIYGENVYAYRGRVYVVGGVTNGTDGPPSAYSSSVYTATIDTSGNIGTFSATTASMSSGRYQGMVDYDPYHNVLYAVGGVGGSGMVAGTDYFPLNEGGPGTIAWSASSSDTGEQRAGMATAQYKNYVYLVGGFNGGYLNTIQMGTIDTGTGNVTWSADETNTLPVTMAYSGAFVANGYLYAVGGRQDDGAAADVTAKIYRAPIDTTTGHLSGAFVDMDTLSPANTMHLTMPREGFGLAVVNSYVYVISGRAWPSGTETEESDYEYAAINSDGTLGSFTEAVDFTIQRSFGFQVAAANNKIYKDVGEANSCTSGVCSSYTNQGDIATVNANHTLTFINAHPASDHYSIDGGLVVYNGYLYHLAGGAQGGGPVYGEVEQTPLLGGGLVSSQQWLYSPTAPVSRTWQSTFVYNGRIYLVGGCQSITVRAEGAGTLQRVVCTGSYPTTENHASIQSILRIANYSRLFTTDKDTTPVNFLSRFVSNNTALPVSYAIASSSSPVLGSSTALSLTSELKNDLSGAPQSAYYLFNFVLDDTNNAVFPDSVGTPTTLNYFQLNYHPNSSMRLRGGKTFNTGAVQSLDAP